jgi:type II secretory pathway pseudopilin PulG
MTPHLSTRLPRSDQGYSYIALLILVAVMGALLAGASVSWSKMRQREKEVELLFIGNQFRLAIQRYYSNPLAGVQAYPRQLEDLLQDARLPSTQRYLREIYIDPMTGHHKWGLVTTPEGHIMGVYSLSSAAPINRKTFSTANAGFENQEKYSDWRFIYTPGSLQLPLQR